MYIIIILLLLFLLFSRKDEHFQLVSGYIPTERAIDYTDDTTLSECIDNCTYNQQCMSANYNSHTGQCIMHNFKRPPVVRNTNYRNVHPSGLIAITMDHERSTTHNPFVYKTMYTR